MATSAPGLEANQTEPSDCGLSTLSLSSQTVHADDFLNKGQDVAPPLHVSTTFRYNRDPTQLTKWVEHDVKISTFTLSFSLEKMVQYQLTCLLAKHPV